jgi:hypothetical protein
MLGAAGSLGQESPNMAAVASYDSFFWQQTLNLYKSSNIRNDARHS